MIGRVRMEGVVRKMWLGSVQVEGRRCEPCGLGGNDVYPRQDGV